MARRKWTITTYVTGHRRDINLIVYDKAAILRREATKFAKRVGERNPDFSEAKGVCHGFDRIHIAADGTETSDPHAVTIRLTVGSVTALVVSHEVAHAAQHLYLLDVLGYDSREAATAHFDSANETFAHTLGEIFNAAWTALSSAGLTESPSQEG